MIRRVLFIISFFLGGLVIEALLRLGGGSDAGELDPTTLPTCQPGQSMQNACMPSQYGDMQDMENQTKDLAQDLNY